MHFKFGILEFIVKGYVKQSLFKNKLFAYLFIFFFFFFKILSDKILHALLKSTKQTF